MNVSKEIRTLATDVTDHVSRLNKEAVWLFLATLGLWGVTNKPLQFVALCITLLIFTQTVLRPGKSFYKRRRELAVGIQSQDLPPRVKSDAALELKAAVAPLKLCNMLKNNPLYWSVMLFLALSVGEFARGAVT